MFARQTHQWNPNDSGWSRSTKPTILSPTKKTGGQGDLRKVTFLVRGFPEVALTSRLLFCAQDGRLGQPWPSWGDWVRIDSSWANILAPRANMFAHRKTWKIVANMFALGASMFAHHWLIIIEYYIHKYLWIIFSAD